MEHASTVRHESKTAPGVTFRVARMSMSRRIELTRMVRELGQKCEFLKAGSSWDDQVQAALISQEMDRLYLQWGLVEVHGLRIDGEEAGPELVISKGPETLTQEMVAAVKAECHLSEAERKN